MFKSSSAFPAVPTQQSVSAAVFTDDIWLTPGAGFGATSGGNGPIVVEYDQADPQKAKMTWSRNPSDAGGIIPVPMHAVETSRVRFLDETGADVLAGSQTGVKDLVLPPGDLWQIDYKVTTQSISVSSGNRFADWGVMEAAQFEAAIAAGQGSPRYDGFLNYGWDAVTQPSEDSTGKVRSNTGIARIDRRNATGDLRICIGFLNTGNTNSIDVAWWHCGLIVRSYSSLASITAATAPQLITPAEPDFNAAGDTRVDVALSGTMTLNRIGAVTVGQKYTFAIRASANAALTFSGGFKNTDGVSYNPTFTNGDIGVVEAVGVSPTELAFTQSVRVT